MCVCLASQIDPEELVKERQREREAHRAAAAAAEAAPVKREPLGASPPRAEADGAAAGDEVQAQVKVPSPQTHQQGDGVKEEHMAALSHGEAASVSAPAENGPGAVHPASGAAAAAAGPEGHADARAAGASEGEPAADAAPPANLPFTERSSHVSPVDMDAKPGADVPQGDAAASAADQKGSGGDGAAAGQQDHRSVGASGPRAATTAADAQELLATLPGAASDADASGAAPSAPESPSPGAPAAAAAAVPATEFGAAAPAVGAGGGGRGSEVVASAGPSVKRQPLPEGAPPAAPTPLQLADRCSLAWVPLQAVAFSSCCFSWECFLCARSAQHPPGLTSARESYTTPSRCLGEIPECKPSVDRTPPSCRNCHSIACEN